MQDQTPWTFAVTSTTTCTSWKLHAQNGSAKNGNPQGTLDLHPPILQHASPINEAHSRGCEDPPGTLASRPTIYPCTPPNALRKGPGKEDQPGTLTFPTGSCTAVRGTQVRSRPSGRGLGLWALDHWLGTKAANAMAEHVNTGSCRGRANPPTHRPKRKWAMQHWQGVTQSP